MNSWSERTTGKSTAAQPTDSDFPNYHSSFHHAKENYFRVAYQSGNSVLKIFLQYFLLLWNSTCLSKTHFPPICPHVHCGPLQTPSLPRCKRICCVTRGGRRSHVTCRLRVFWVRAVRRVNEEHRRIANMSNYFRIFRHHIAHLFSSQEYHLCFYYV